MHEQCGFLSDSTVAELAEGQKPHVQRTWQMHVKLIKFMGQQHIL